MSLFLAATQLPAATPALAPVAALSPEVLAKWLALITGVLGGAWGAWAKAIGPAYRTCRAFFMAVTSAVALVEKELRPNGGGSLRDTVNATRREVQQLSLSQALTSAMQRTQAASSRYPMFQAGPDGMCTWVNDTWSRVTGIPGAEAQGMGWVNGIHADDRARVIEDWQHAVEDVRAFRSDFRYRHVDTLDDVLVRVEAHPVRTAEGALAGFIGAASLLDAIGREPFPAFDRRRSTGSPLSHNA